MGNDDEKQSLLTSNVSSGRSSIDDKNCSFFSKITSTRFQLAYLGFIGFMIVFAIRMCINVALVSMVADSSQKSSSVNDHCPTRNTTSYQTEIPANSRVYFDWTVQEQARILGAYFYGRLFTQIPIGSLVSAYGGKHVLGFGILLSGLLTAAIVPAAYLGPNWVLVCRLLIGVVDSGTFSGYFQMVAKWAPKQERTVFSTMATAGAYLGNVFGFPLVGYLCGLEFAGGWPLPFLGIGGITVIWFIAWSVLIYETPADHPRISLEERELLMTSVDYHTIKSKQKEKIPWKKIVTSKRVYALLVARWADGIFGMGLSMCLSQYFSYVLNLDISTNGLLSAAPWLSCFLASFVFSTAADYLINQNYFSITFVRKYNQAIAAIFPGILLIATGYSGCSVKMALLFLSAAAFFFGSHFSGSVCNVLDLAPKHAGILTAFGNTASSLAGSVAPIIVGAIIEKDAHSDLLWRRVFMFYAAVSWLGGIVFVAFGSGKAQMWSK